MKTFLSVSLALLLVFACLPTWAGALEIDPANPIYINETNFPDSFFRDYIGRTFQKNEGQALSSNDRLSLKEIHVENPEEDKRIASLMGIKYFPNLEKLFCSGNALEGLDLKENPKLKELDCSDNSIGTLDISQHPELTALNCANNKLTNLDISANKALKTLDCANNAIERLDFSSDTNPYLGEMKWQPQNNVEITTPEPSPSESPIPSETPTPTPTVAPPTATPTATPTPKVSPKPSNKPTDKIPLVLKSNTGFFKVKKSMENKMIDKTLEKHKINIKVTEQNIAKVLKNRRPKKKGYSFSAWKYEYKDKIYKLPKGKKKAWQHITQRNITVLQGYMYKNQKA